MLKENPKIALVHDSLIQFGGAEKTLEAICELYPDAPIYTGLYKRANFPDEFKNKVVKGNSSKLFTTFAKYISFLMPIVFEGMDLRDYDIIISDSACWAKGVLTKPEQLHISYIHTPPRFLYKYSVESTKRNSWYFKPFITVIDAFLRMWDYQAGQRPNFLIANSLEVKDRIFKFYKRNAQVIYPPVNVSCTNEAFPEYIPYKDYFVAVGRIVAYKNFDLLVKAFNELPYNLVIVGAGSEKEKLQKLANSNIYFAGRVSETEKHKILHNALGLINPVQDEDFGIVPIEAMAHGVPVMAHRSGGAKEMVTEHMTGTYFVEVSVNEIKERVMNFYQLIKKGEYDKCVISENVKRFSKERFKQEFSNFVDAKWAELHKENA
jgi:glycosyltransferase involved in cell wall biosynthesis